jgi:hypothetical protein
MSRRNDSNRFVLYETGSAALERALKQLAPAFGEGVRAARFHAHFVSKHERRRRKAIVARRRIARHKERVSRTLSANL